MDARDGAASERVYDQGDDEFWSIKTVMAKTGLCRTSIYDYMARGMFPRRRRLGLRKVGWLASEVRGWIVTRPL
jgi:prophage regulatory protein